MLINKDAKIGSKAIPAIPTRLQKVMLNIIEQPRADSPGWFKGTASRYF